MIYFSATLAALANVMRKTGVDQLFNQLVRPKLRNFVPEIYKDVSYILDEESYSVSSNENIVQKRFLKAWQALMDGFNVSKFHSCVLLHKRMKLLLRTILLSRTSSCSLIWSSMSLCVHGKNTS